MRFGVVSCFEMASRWSNGFQPFGYSLQRLKSMAIRRRSNEQKNCCSQENYNEIGAKVISIIEIVIAHKAINQMIISS